MTTTTLYKATTTNGGVLFANDFTYPLPSGKRKGEWVHANGELVECENGFHACVKPVDILKYIIGKDWVVWEAEAKGEQQHFSDKSVFSSMRLVRRFQCDDVVLRLFAADCAERALRCAGVTDDRCWNAVTMARRFVFGDATVEELAAARDAAWAAARDTAKAAAWVAANAAASGAALIAALIAAMDASRDAERDWQSRRLLQYFEHGVEAMNLECE